MSRIVSFITLMGILVVIGVLFYQVVAEFLLPMFLAMLLVIMFGPLHRWFLVQCKGRSHLAAGLTTTTILLVCLAPLLAILVQASAEGMAIYQRLGQLHLDRQKQTQQVKPEQPQPEEPERLEPDLSALQPLAESIAGLGKRVGIPLKADDIEKNITRSLEEWLAPVALSTTQFVGNLLLGLLVMIVSLYFFLVDGPQMMQAILRLAPLDPRYEEQLVEDFGNISRAVVLATLASSVVQGLLAGIGLYWAGFRAIFLWIVATMLLSMVPFVGAVSVWITACAWLFFIEGRTTATILLAIYGAMIVSTVDNIIKPMILHGRSNLHPLLALLSVLGGVKALGAIGIFVGPMVVALLQTLLKMLRTELEEMSNAAGKAPKAKAGNKGAPGTG